MRSLVPALALILSLFSQFAVAVDCGGVLATAPGLEIKVEIEVTFDPYTKQPTFRLVPPPEQHRSSPSLGAIFHDLMSRRQLIHQNDIRLGSRDLLIENGGLCASTCGVNVLHAMVSYQFGHVADFTRKADHYLHRILEEVYKNTRTDGRLGLTLSELAIGMDELRRDLNLQISTEFVQVRPGAPIFMRDLIPAENELIIASIRQGQSGGHALYHAIVITDADPERKLISYSDPNRPNAGARASMIPFRHVDGEASVKIGTPIHPHSGPQEGVINSYLRVKMRR